MQFDTLIRGGTVVTPGGTLVADIGISGETIEAIGVHLGADANGATEIDATGHYVLPGILDVHVSLSLDAFGTVSSDDFESGTRAAARGGVTTVVDHAIPASSESLSDAVDRRMAEAELSALVDFTFHPGLIRWPEDADEIERLVERGFPTFKAFMVHESEAWQVSDRAIFAALERMRTCDAMLLLHAESADVLDELIERHHTKEAMAAQGARLHATTRPNFIEAEAIQRAILWSEITGGQLYITHMSTAEGAELVKSAQLRGVPVVAETCPHYLVLDESVFDQEDGHLFVSCPQVRKQSDAARLWKGMRSGEVSVVSSDSCTYTRAQKNAWNGDFTRVPPGLPGIETLLPVLYTHGVRFGRLSIEELVRLLSTNPAHIMGLYPQKGAIQVGADADLAIIHPTLETTLQSSTMETRADWSPYESWSLAGFARTTVSRGEIVVDDYRVVGSAGRGRWLSRSRAGLFPSE